MPTAAFATLGCKVNQYETQKIIDSFEAFGFFVTEFHHPADVYVINSCSVTQSAEQKSRHMLHRLYKQNPEAIIILTGCYAEMLHIKSETAPEATIIIPNQEKSHVLDHLLQKYPHLQQKSALDAGRDLNQPPAKKRTRATIKIQDGCNIFCSYCSIPYTRSRMLSRPYKQILQELEEVASRGYSEVVVTGVLVGSYGPDTGSDGPELPELLQRMTHVEGIKRVRLSSIEPTQVNDALLRTYKEEPALCNHLHVPLQSGDSGVLKAMNRPYDRDFYLRLCEKVYQVLPEAAITTDILVGFPGENEKAFQNTVDVVRSVEFARSHIFRYSPRPGTPAMALGENVSEQDKEQRSHILADICKDTQQRYVSRFLGKSLPVLIESKEKEGGLLSGYTENYIRAVFTGGSKLIGSITPVRLLTHNPNGALGEVCNTYQPEADMLYISVVSGTVDIPS
jgi:threonylcarbamoyladenosine tRNA methylthiotransferase MtaB